MNIARNPVSTRIELLAQSVARIGWVSSTRLLPPSGRRWTGTSPSVDSTQLGIRMHSTAPTKPSSAVNTNAPGEPNIQVSAAAMAPATPPAISPNTVNREFVATRVIASGSTRGVSDALSTPNDLENTSDPSAHG